MTTCERIVYVMLTGLHYNAGTGGILLLYTDTLSRAVIGAYLTASVETATDKARSGKRSHKFSVRVSFINGTLIQLHRKDG